MRKEIKVVTMKVSVEEYKKLKERANGQPVSTYIKSLIAREGKVTADEGRTWANFEKKIEDLSTKLSIIINKKDDSESQKVFQKDIKENVIRLQTLIAAMVTGDIKARVVLKNTFPKLYDMIIK